MTMELIQHIELGSAQANIEFTSIASTYTDLYISLSLRTARASTESECYLQVNSDTTSGRYQMIRLYADGSSAYSQSITTGGDALRIGFPPAANATSNTFGNFGIYIPNYAGSTSKSISIDSVGENNATRALSQIAAGLYTQTTAISSIKITDLYANFVQGSSATLYGIKSAGTSAKATGGTIYYDAANSKYVHVFTASGTFTPTQNLTGVEYLVIAGGGGGGHDRAGGGGAGGYRSSVVGQLSGGGASAEATLSLTSGTNYTVTVGAGGAGVNSGRGNNGSNSVFGSITSTGGGGGGGIPTNTTGAGGGSGGGGRAGAAGGAGTSGQGYSGGSGNGDIGGGGGGAGEAGDTDAPGFGGDGLSNNITGTAVMRGGGGGGGFPYGTGGTGGEGGGASAPGSAFVNSDSGTANTGGGGAGGAGGGYFGGNGGSGIVIVRYSA